MMTMREARQRMSQCHMRLQKEFGEFRVTPYMFAPSSQEAENVAYYTDDLEDAVLTAINMARNIVPIH